MKDRPIYGLTAGFLIVAVPFAVAWQSVGNVPGRSAPDDRLTPGAVTTTDEGEVCGYVGGQSYSVRHRQISIEFKDWIFREYGIEPPSGSERREWEIDHRVPLSLGGADTAANLWPEPGTGRDNYHDKDEIEFQVWRAVCKRHTLTLAQGQAIFLGDWRYHGSLR